jgi:AcrR family transcriptional regulator
MDEIARAAGVTKPMLYRYFGSKEDLYAVFLRMTGHELIDRVRAPDTRGQPAEVRLRAGLQGFLSYVEAHRAGWTVLHGESTTVADARIAHEIDELRGRIISMLTAFFRDEAVAHAFAGAAESLATWWLNQPQASIDDATNILMKIAQAAAGFRAQA